MQYKIPQNVQIEDKIVSFLTIRQLIICSIGGGIAYVFYITLAPIYYAEVWGPPVFLTSLLTLAIAFLKINDIRFTKWVLLLSEFLINPRRRVWDKTANSDLLFGFIHQQKSTPQKNKQNKEKIEKKQKDLSSLEENLHKLDQNLFLNSSSQEIDQASDHHLSASAMLSQEETEKHQKRLKQSLKDNLSPEDKKEAIKKLSKQIEAEKQQNSSATKKNQTSLHEISKEDFLKNKQNKKSFKRAFPMPNIDPDHKEIAARENQDNLPNKFRPVRDKKIDTQKEPNIKIIKNNFSSQDE